MHLFKINLINDYNEANLTDDGANFMRYRIGKFGWKIAYKLGAKLWFRYQVFYDADAKVFVATSPDVQGLTVEHENYNEIKPIVMDCARSLVWGTLHPDVEFLKEHPEPFQNNQFDLNGKGFCCNEIDEKI